MSRDYELSVDARGRIQQLKNNLVDRYPRDSILKELLQNADAAGPNRLELGWSAGLAGAAHPLLRGPGLFAANDGPFRPEDAQAIRSFGLNHKAADRSTIGKFGLGLKSVFHLCEAFFFLTSVEPVGGGIVNPWAGTGFHDDRGRLFPIETSSLPAYEPTRTFCLKRGYEQAAVVRDFYADGDDRVIFRNHLLT